MEITRFSPLCLVRPGDVCAQAVRTASGRTIAPGEVLCAQDIEDLAPLPGIWIRLIVDPAVLAQAMPAALRAYQGQDVLSPLGQALLHLRAEAEAERILRRLPPLAPPAPRADTVALPRSSPVLDAHGFEPPELPAVAQQLVAALAEDRLDAAAIARIVGQSPGLTARLLRLVNSPAFGLPRAVDRIDRAVALVGVRELTLLASSLLLIEHFGLVPQTLVDVRSFFAHSLAVAAAARHLAQGARPELAETAFAAGLLHDIGRLYCLSVFPERASVCLTWCQAHGRSARAVEATVFGMEHAPLGGQLLSAWQLPETLTQAVAGHHRPEGYLDAVVHAADCLAHAAALGASGDCFPPRAVAKAMDLAHTSPEDLVAAARTAQTTTDAFLAALV